MIARCWAASKHNFRYLLIPEEQNCTAYFTDQISIKKHLARMPNNPLGYVHKHNLKWHILTQQGQERKVTGRCELPELADFNVLELLQHEPNEHLQQGQSTVKMCGRGHFAPYLVWIFNTFPDSTYICIQECKHLLLADWTLPEIPLIPLLNTEARPLWKTQSTPVHTG